MEFKKEDDAKMHTDIFKNSLGGIHFMMTRNRRERFWNCFWNLTCGRLFRVVGAYIIYFIVIHHFHIELSFLESALIGLGMGLYIV